MQMPSRRLFHKTFALHIEIMDLQSCFMLINHEFSMTILAISYKAIKLLLLQLTLFQCNNIR